MRSPTDRDVIDGFTRRLRMAVTLTGHKDKEVAAKIGVRANTFSQYMRGIHPMPYGALVRFCDRYGFTTEWLLRGDLSTLRPGLSDQIDAFDFAGAPEPPGAAARAARKVPKPC